MALTLKLTPGTVVTESDLWTVALLNLLANPTVELEGTLGSISLADASVTTAKLADGALSADSPGRAKMADAFITTAKLLDGLLTADAAGRLKMADGFVTSAKILDGTIVNADVGAAAAIASSKLSIATGGGLTAPGGTVTYPLYASAEVVTTVAGTTSFGHGLGGQPSMVHGVLVCKSAELGYSVGDEVSTAVGVMSVGASATNVWVTINSSAGPFQLLNKSTGTAGNLTKANWNAKVYGRP